MGACRTYIELYLIYVYWYVQYPTAINRTKNNLIKQNIIVNDAKRLKIIVNLAGN